MSPTKDSQTKDKDNDKDSDNDIDKQNSSQTQAATNLARWQEVYKATLNLPKTDFPMKGNLPKTEPEVIARWQTNKIYQKMLDKNAQSTVVFTMPDGPPYANGSIHIGTALNKCLKDFVIKYRNIAGQRAAFIPGWDCHGLPIEFKVTKELGAQRAEKSDADLRKLCRQEAQKWVEHQRAQFIRLGILADWQRPYLTMDPAYEAEIVRELGRMLERGVLYRGEKPVYWCPTMQTALAEAEVEYRPRVSPSIYVKFPLPDASPLGVSGRHVSAVAWTTTPWTLPANQALAVHSDFVYELFEVPGELLLLAQKLAASVRAESGLELKPTGKTFTGRELEGLAASHPFYPRPSPFVLAGHVSLEAGTGIVHTAPGHGQDDYQVGLKYHLPIFSPVDEAGRYTAEVPEYQGTSIFAANPLIIERLKQEGLLLAHKEFEHSYPHNWRSKTPLIFRATPQWFVRMDDEVNNIRSTSLLAIDELKFYPEWGRRRLRAMIENRPDWCVSRQRFWGVPIPVFYCRQCSAALAQTEIMYKVADRMEAEDGIEAFYRTPIAEFTGEQRCSSCGGSEFERSRDILDVWFDSGVCHAAVQKRRPELSFPADIYLEGSDQHRGWFQSSLLTSIAVNGEPPYRALVTHGFVNDVQGRKMSKSLGNVVDPTETTSQLGADILRLWVAHEDFGQDLTCGKESFERITETYRRFRNTARFLLGNLFDYEPARDALPYENLTPIDQWALHRLAQLIEKCQVSYDNYEFYKVYHALNTFFTVDLSATYLDVLKDRLYTWRANSPERRASQTVFFEITQACAVLLAPILSFLSEEIYLHLQGPKKESVFLCDFPRAPGQWKNPQIEAQFIELLAVRSEVAQVLEELRREKVIGSSLEAEVEIFAQTERLRILRAHESHLGELLIVSRVHLADGPFRVQAKKALGEKCVRCWNYSEKRDERFPSTCPKCWRALTGREDELRAQL